MKLLGQKKMDLPTNVMDIFAKMHESSSNNLNKIIKGIDEFIKESGDRLGDKQVSEVFSIIEEHRQKAFHLSEDIYGSATDAIPKAVRRPRGWNKLAEKAEPIMNWFKEAPKERIGGLALLSLAAGAIMNLTTGSTIDSKDDIPSMNNPGMEASSTILWFTRCILWIKYAK